MDTASNPSKIYIERDRNGLYGLHVSNIAPDLNESDLRGLFHTSGFIKVCKIIRISGNIRVAFVKFVSHDEALNALKKVNGMKVGDFVLEVRPAYESRSWKAQKQNKDGRSSVESLTKKEDKPLESLHQTCHGEQKNNEQKETKEKSESPAKREDDPSRTYILPAASQDARYSNSSSSSLASSSDKTPVKPSTFNNVPFRAAQKRTTAGSQEGKTQADNPSTSKVKKCYAETPLTKAINDLSLANEKKSPSGQKKDVLKWSVDEVAHFFERHEECSPSILAFIRDQEIDGNALMLVEETSLLHFMKLGPTLKFLNMREKLKH